MLLGADAVRDLPAGLPRDLPFARGRRVDLPFDLPLDLPFGPITTFPLAAPGIGCHDRFTGSSGLDARPTIEVPVASSR